MENCIDLSHLSPEKYDEIVELLCFGGGRGDEVLLTMEVCIWCLENLKGDFEIVQGKLDGMVADAIAFENEVDAIAFKLKWL